LNQWIDLMYLSTLDLLGNLISESRTSVPSSSQVSWLYQHVFTLYTVSPRTYSPFTQLARVCTHPIHRQPAYASENSFLWILEFFCQPFVLPQMFSTSYASTSIYKKLYTQKYIYNMYKCVFMSELCLLFISSCSLTLSLF
jgi:hypothetical protein